MSEPVISLKDQNASTLRLFVGGVVLAFVVLHSGASLIDADLTLSSLPSSLDPIRLGVPVVGGVFSLLLLNLLPTPVKGMLVYWRRHDALPGSRAFTDLGPKDERVDMGVLESALGQLPTVPTEQNQLWYRIYQKHEDRPGVRDAHKSYLLYRELASVSLLLLGLLVLASALALGMPGRIEIVFALLLTGVYLLAAVNARNSGSRFVTNVLAAETAEAGPERPASQIVSA